MVCVCQNKTRADFQELCRGNGFYRCLGPDRCEDRSLDAR